MREGYCSNKTVALVKVKMHFLCKYLLRRHLSKAPEKKFSEKNPGTNIQSLRIGF
jgi:hypothetical protein